MSNKRHRLNLALSEWVAERLDRLVQEVNAESRTDLIRRALAVYDECVDTQKAGGRVVLESKDGERTQLRIVW